MTKAFNTGDATRSFRFRRHKTYLKNVAKTELRFGLIPAFEIEQRKQAGKAFNVKTRIYTIDISRNCFLFAPMRKTLFPLIFSSMTLNTFALSVDYKISIQNPATHYAHVTMDIKDVKEKTIYVKMPVWTPGSYMVREFERNVEQVLANSDDASLTVQKTDKSTWKIENPKGLKHVRVSYRLYCFENTVRTSYIDSDHAFLLLTSALMYADRQGPGTLEIEYPETWTAISTTLPQVKPNHFTFENYDELVDSPIEIGNHRELRFEVAGVVHRVAMVGSNNCPTDKFTKDLEKICRTMYEIVGAHPCKSYLFIVHHVEEGGGGLEHANSNVVQMRRFAYSNKEQYLAFLSLCAHEYFHLWNVKRIRPAALGPFDYSRENHSKLLWVAEGITSYYDELAMYRAGFRTETEYLRILSGTFSATLNRKGAEVQSMHDASFDAWIKEYRPNENSINSQISYYMKGAAMAALLDIELLSATQGKQGLDHLMRYLYNEFYIQKQRGFSDDEFYAAIDHIAGKPIGFKTWAEETNNSETNARIAAILKKAACSIGNKAQENPYYTGISIESKGEKVLVRSVEGQSPAYGADIQAGDEIIAINGIRVRTQIDELIKSIGSGVKLSFLIARAGLIRTVEIAAVLSPKLELQITVDNGDDNILKAWLKKND